MMTRAEYKQRIGERIEGSLFWGATKPMSAWG